MCDHLSLTIVGGGTMVPIFDFRGLHISHPQDRVMVNWDPPHPCRMEAGAGSDHDGTRNIYLYVPGHQFAIFIQVSNKGRILSVHKSTNEIYS